MVKNIQRITHIFSKSTILLNRNPNSRKVNIVTKNDVYFVLFHTLNITCITFLQLEYNHLKMHHVCVRQPVRTKNIDIKIETLHTFLCNLCHQNHIVIKAANRIFQGHGYLSGRVLPLPSLSTSKSSYCLCPVR